MPLSIPNKCYVSEISVVYFNIFDQDCRCQFFQRINFALTSCLHMTYAAVANIEHILSGV